MRESGDKPGSVESGCSGLGGGVGGESRRSGLMSGRGTSPSAAVWEKSGGEEGNIFRSVWNN